MKEYLNQEIDCSCGKTHKIPIKEVIVSNRALERLPELMDTLSNHNKLYLIADINTYKAAGKSAKEICSAAGYDLETIILKDKHLIPDTASFFKIISQIKEPGYILACGSGTINDLSRYVSYTLGRPYSIIATAPSMDGYASSVASLIVEGVKKTYKAQPPEAIIADLNVLQESPWKMIQAGFGDLLGKNTSLMDWKLSKILMDEYYCEEAVGLVYSELAKIMEIGPKLKNRDKQSMEILINGLIKSGLAMLMIGSSRPASGSEHHISHFLEMYGFKYNVETPPHGIKVALGTYFTSSFYLELNDLNFEEITLKDNKQQRIQQIKENYPDMAGPILKNLEERWEQELISHQHFLNSEQPIKEMIKKSAPGLQKIESYLKETGILQREDVKTLDRQWLAKAMKYGFEIRARFTVTTLLKKMGLLEETSDSLLARYKSISPSS